MVINPTYAVLSRVTRAMRGGSQKVTNDDEGEGGGVTIPPKIDDVRVSVFIVHIFRI